MSDKAPRKSEVQYVSWAGLQLIGLQSWDPGRTEVEADTTAAGDEIETSGKIRESLSPTATVLIDTGTAGAALEAVLYPGNTGNLIWGKKGSSAGSPKDGIRARLVKCDPVLERDGEQMLDLEWKAIDPTYLYDSRDGATF